MAFTVAQTGRGNDFAEYSVIATANGDTNSPNIVHGMGANPMVTLIPILQAVCAASKWALTTLDITNAVVSKSGIAGGDAGIQLRVRIERRR